MIYKGRTHRKGVPKSGVREDNKRKNKIPGSFFQRGEEKMGKQGG